ncbi:MAG: aspartate aminotransferase family protein [bacterium]
MTIMTLEERHSSGVYGKREIAISRGEGATVWDGAGRAYVDCVAGIGVANVGHSHPAVVAAIQEQARTLLSCPELFYHERRAALQAKLVQHLPSGLERIYLCNSGAEAVEAALKFARLSSGRSNVVAAMRGFHGRTMGALSATFEKKYRRPFAPLVPGFSHVPFDNIERLEQAVDGQTAAVILEAVQGEGGVRPGSRQYFQAARRLCDEHGALLIFDEVQTGFGRTGRWFACEHVGLIPDMLCLGKAIGGGVPMGAVALGPRVQGLSPGVHGSTFGGNPLACAAALATLSVLEEEQLVPRAARLGHTFMQQLQALQSPLLREVRGLGLMLGLELKLPARHVVEALMERGVLALTAGTTVLRLLPPLVITEEQLTAVAGSIQDALDQVLETHGARRRRRQRQAAS